MLFKWCKCIHVLLLWAKFHWKIPLGKWFSKFWPKSKWRGKKIGYLAIILKRYNIFKSFFAELWFFYSPYIYHFVYGANSLQNYGGKVVFLRGVPWNPPWAPMGVKVSWSLNSLQNYGGKVVFLRGVPWNSPWAPMGVKVSWSLKC